MSNYSALKNVRKCTHIKVTGVRCGSPAMREEQFCYFHQRMFRGVRTPPNSRLHPIALVEDEESIQASLMEIINALARNHIDLRRADLILKAIYIAEKNARRVRFGFSGDMVREVPEYATPERRTPPPPAPAIDESELVNAPQLEAASRLDLNQIDPTQRKSPQNVGKARNKRKQA